MGLKRIVMRGFGLFWWIMSMFWYRIDVKSVVLVGFLAIFVAFLCVFEVFLWVYYVLLVL